MGGVGVTKISRNAYASVEEMVFDGIRAVTPQTMTVPATNPGSLSLDSLGGEGTLALNVNGAGFSTGPWTISDGQSIQARATGLASVGNTATGNLVDQTTGQIVAAITIERTS